MRMKQLKSSERLVSGENSCCSRYMHLQFVRLLQGVSRKTYVCFKIDGTEGGFRRGILRDLIFLC